MAKQSKLWYLLPIFIPLIGGIVGYAIHAKDNKKFARNLLLVGIIWFVALIALALVGVSAIILYIGSLISGGL
jgi:hypothetical protein